MTDDYRNDEFNLYSTPKPYRYFKVIFKALNKITGEYTSMPFYISAKRSKSWLEEIMSGHYYMPLPTDVFEFSWQVYEVPDNPDIIFHHITTRESWERCSVKYMLTCVLTHPWKQNFFQKILKKFQRFWKSILFINRKQKIITIKTI